MARRSKGSRNKTRKLLRVRGKSKKVTLTEMLKSLKVGDSAVIKIAPSVHGGMPHPRHYGRVGIVVGKRGGSYILEVRDKEKTKRVIAAPAHLKKI